MLLLVLFPHQTWSKEGDNEFTLSRRRMEVEELQEAAACATVERMTDVMERFLQKFDQVQYTDCASP